VEPLCDTTIPEQSMNGLHLNKLHIGIFSAYNTDNCAITLLENRFAVLMQTVKIGQGEESFILH
jgi:hypothetical protein